MVYTCSYPYDDDEYTEDLTIKKLRKYGLFAADAAAVEKNKPDLLQRRTLNWEAKDVKRVSVAAKRYTPDIYAGYIVCLKKIDAWCICKNSHSAPS